MIRHTNRDTGMAGRKTAFRNNYWIALINVPIEHGGSGPMLSISHWGPWDKTAATECQSVHTPVQAHAAGSTCFPKVVASRKFLGERERGWERLPFYCLRERETKPRHCCHCLVQRYFNLTQSKYESNIGVTKIFADLDIFWIRKWMRNK